jgi:DNA modification methylase
MMELRPIVVDKNFVVLGGNMRLDALKANGMTEIPDEWVKRASELTEEQKQEFIIKDNAGFGEWDWSALASDWSELPLADWGVDLPEDFAAPVEEDEGAVAEMVDRAAELQVKWDTKSGQLWEIGSNSAPGKKHRLLIGDSTEKGDVGRLCADVRPSLMVTDPPYGVSYDPTWRDEAGGQFGDGKTVMRGKVANDDEVDWSKAYELFPGDVAYVWHAGIFAGEVAANLHSVKFDIRTQIVWVKQHFVLSRGAYHWQHEPCWYAVRRGKKSLWTGDRTQSTAWQIASLNPAGGNKQEAKTGHGTQKPLECMARPIRNHEGDVYDPFVGSGTTLVAAESLKRSCYALEISPPYAAVCLERLSALGLVPELTK